MTLEQEIAEVTRTARGYEARHQFIEDFHYPDGIKVAVNFTCDFDAMLLRRLLNEPPGQLAQGEFGGRVGIWRLIELFSSHDVKATIFTPGRICELYPESLKAAAAEGHEIADHMWEHQVPKDRQLEYDHIVKSVNAIEQTVGKKPVGTRSGYNKEFLIKEGFIYDSHGSAAHLPYYQYDREGEHCLLNLPFHFAIDDAMYYSFAWLGSENSAQRITEPGRVEEMWWQAFKQAYDDGTYLNICLHPFVSGRALRIEMLDRLIRRMKELPGVWFPSCGEMARYCLEQFPLRQDD